MSKKTIVKVILKTLYFRKVTNNVMNKNELLNTIQVEEQVTPKTRNRKLPCFSIFGDTSHMSTIQYMKD